MKFVDEFRDRELIAKVAGEIKDRAGERGYAFMEVCGTHTMAIFRYGLRDLLPPNIRLISGPGCPVCVTPNDYLDKAIAIAGLEGVIVATFGDMIRIPSSRSSLAEAKAAGASVKAVYSTEDALDIARRHPDKQVVFLGVGFETTIPTVASSIITAKREAIKNYSVLCGHKTMPEALRALTCDKTLNIDGFLLPGHVSVIIGTEPYAFLARDLGKRCVVAGFEPLDIMQAILMLICQKTPKVDIQYKRAMHRSGNALARDVIDKVFAKAPSVWRGIGRINASGLKIRKEFASFDAEERFHPRVKTSADPKGCLCGEVLKGAKVPGECALFGKACTPEHPIGACMVSGEGTCAAYFKYEL